MATFIVQKGDVFTARSGEHVLTGRKFAKNEIIDMPLNIGLELGDELVKATEETVALIAQMVKAGHIIPPSSVPAPPKAG